MADPRSIHEFTTGEVEATTLLLGDFVDLDAQSGYTTLKMSVSDLGEVLLEDIEYTQDLQTVDKTIIGGINENKSVIGYSYDEYDATTAYSKDDLCIYNKTLYKALQATTGNLPTNTTYWEPTSIADEIGRIDGDVSALQEMNIYDNTERVIGSFYGSNLYRKCFVVPNITIPRNSIVNIDISDYITGSIRLLKISIVVHAGTDFIILPYSYANQANQKYEIGYAVNQNQITLSRGDSSDITAQDITVVAEYIKVV